MTVTWQSHVSVCCCCTCFEFLVTCLGQAEVSGELKRTVKIKISSFFHYCIITLPCLAPSETVGPPLSSDAASWRTSVATTHHKHKSLIPIYSILHCTKRWAISTWSRQIPLPFPELRCAHIIVSRIASWGFAGLHFSIRSPYYIRDELVPQFHPEWVTLWGRREKRTVFPHLHSLVWHTHTYHQEWPPVSVFLLLLSSLRSCDWKTQ